MNYRDQVRDQIKDMGKSASEALALWEDLAESFEADGAEGVQSNVEERIEKLREKFQATLEALEDML